MARGGGREELLCVLFTDIAVAEWAARSAATDGLLAVQVPF